jgi:membrane peptidoglycan carboxypeptidase
MKTNLHRFFKLTKPKRKKTRKLHKEGQPLRSSGSKVHPPKNHIRRWLWYANPKRFRDFWFTKKGMKSALKIAAFNGGLLLLVVIGVFLYFSKDLPSPGQINSLRLAQTARFYDRTGKILLYEVHGDENRSVVKLDAISDNMRNATIAIEDKDFYNHGAFSAIGIIRSAINNVLNRGITGGGSTITQQYVKNALLTPEQTYTRKLKELILSIQIEQLYSKDDILELYLNEIPYGTQAYGAQAASKTFFDKDASKLTIEEAALLAALPQLPTFYSPYGENTDQLLARQQRIIGLMHEQAYISEEEAAEAKKVEILKKINQSPSLYADIKAPHFVLHVQQQLENKYGARDVNEGGWEIITSLDFDKQTIAEKAVRDNIRTVDNLGGNNAALVAADPKTGQVLAMVGSRDFRYKGYGSFNAALAGRQPGSSFKPYAYATLFKDDSWGAGSIMYDLVTDFGGYRPNNFDFRSKGAMPIRRALAESRNIPAIKALYIAGIDNVIEQAHKQGITTLNAGPGQYGLSLVLGAGEVKLADHVNGYSAFATGGVHHDPITVLKITDPSGRIIEEWNPTEGERVLDEQIAFSITSILSDDSARSGTFGLNNRNIVVPGLTLAAKTGTTDLSRDGWMMGYSTHMVAGVWVGRNDNKPMNSITSNQTGPIWTQFMREAHKGLKNENFVRPAGLKSATLDAHTGKKPTNATKQTVTDIFPTWYKVPGSAEIQQATIDKISNKLATDCTPDAARQTITSQGIQPEIPAGDPAYARWNGPVQAYAKSLGLGSGGAIPTEKDDVHKCPGDVLTVELKADKTGDDKIELTAEVNEKGHKPTTVDFEYNGAVISSQKYKSSGNTYVFDPPQPGNYSFSVTVTDEVLYTAKDTSDTVIISYYNPDRSIYPAGAPTEHRRRIRFPFSFIPFMLYQFSN